MKFKTKLAVITLALATSITGCTRITDADVGVRLTYGGSIKDVVLEQGLHQTIVGDVIKLSRRNMVLNVNSNPIVSEKIPMEKFETRVNYGIVPENAAIAYKSEKSRHITTKDGDVYLLGQYVNDIAISSINDVISSYKALEVNDNRALIETQIKDTINLKLKASGKDKFVRVNEINILAAQAPKSITASSERIVQTQNELKAKENELDIARKEQEKMKILAQQADGQYINLLKAEAEKTKADAMLVAAQKGTLNTMVIVPSNFTSLGKVN